MSPLPLVTVIVPCYNHEKYITECIQSVLAQSYPHIELMVIDDGSKDQSASMIKALGEQAQFKFQLNQNKGLCKTLNEGLRLTRGELVCVLASDDVMPPERIEEQVKFFLQDPELAVAAGGMSIIDQNSQIIEQKNPFYLGNVTFLRLLFKNVIFAPTAMMRRFAIEKVNGYDEDLLIEDIAMWLKLSRQNFKIMNFSNNWANYRVIAKDSIKKTQYYHANLIKVLRAFRNEHFLVFLAIAYAQIKFFIKNLIR